MDVFPQEPVRLLRRVGEVGRQALFAESLRRVREGLG